MAKWTNDDIDRLIECYENELDIQDIADILGRTASSIKNKAWRLKITHPVVYSEEEIKYIIENYKSYNLREIAKALGREENYHNICRKAKELGLYMSGKKKENTKCFKDENGLWHDNGWVRRDPVELSKERAKTLKELRDNNEHPRGMLGKTHTTEVRKIISDNTKKVWENMTEDKKEQRRVRQVKTKIKNGTLNPNNTRKNPYSRARGGKRSDLDNIYFRSRWEANVARFYNFMKIKWEFEPKTFYFKDIKRGCVSYTPDFYLPEEDRWVEVKGWMDSKSKTKLKRFKKYFPEESARLEIIMQKEYKEISQWSRLIEGWED